MLNPRLQPGVQAAIKTGASLRRYYAPPLSGRGVSSCPKTPVRPGYHFASSSNGLGAKIEAASACGGQA